MKRLLILGCFTAVLLAPTAAAAPSGASITLDQPQPVVAGSTVTFSYTLPKSAPSPRIVVYCYDAPGYSPWALGKWVSDGTSFPILAGYGIVSCTAELGTFKFYFKEIAETTFAVTS